MIAPVNWCWCISVAKLHPYPYIHMRVGHIDGGRFLGACHALVSAEELLTYPNTRCAPCQPNTPAARTLVAVCKWPRHPVINTASAAASLDFLRNAESYYFLGVGPCGMTRQGLSDLGLTWATQSCATTLHPLLTKLGLMDLCSQ